MVNTYEVNRIHRDRAEVMISDKNCKRLPIFAVERDGHGKAKVMNAMTPSGDAVDAYHYMKACCEAIQMVIW
jgi:hypothetical protein